MVINSSFDIFQRKKHLSRVIKLKPLGRYYCVMSPICYHNALQKFDIDKVYCHYKKALYLKKSIKEVKKFVRSKTFYSGIFLNSFPKCIFTLFFSLVKQFYIYMLSFFFLINLPTIPLYSLMNVKEMELLVL